MKSLTPALVLLATVATFAYSDQKPTTSPNASSKPQPVTNLSLTTVVSNVDSNGLSVAIASDTKGAYLDGIEGVTSYLTTNGYNNITWGDWQFDTSNSPTRGVNKSLIQADEVQPGDPHFTVTANPPFIGTRSFKGKIEVKCTFLNKNMLTMHAGDTMTCPLINDFTLANGDAYGMAPARSFSGYPETTDVQIQCNAANSVGCSDWSIDPIDPTHFGQAVARLVLTPAGKPNQPKVNEGDFYMRFHFHLTRP